MPFPFRHPTQSGTVTQSGIADVLEELGRDGPNVEMWLVVELPSDSFSDKIRYDEETDLLLASKGKFIGFARSREELEQMTTTEFTGAEDPDDELEEGKTKEVLPGHVYLTYRAQLRGTADLQTLLEFLLAEKMLQPQTP
jgi:hypothetical protein